MPLGTLEHSLRLARDGPALLIVHLTGAYSRAALIPDAFARNQGLGRSVNILGYDPLWRSQEQSSGLTVILDMHELNAMEENPEGRLEQFLARWQQLATPSRSAPDGVLFDILNELSTRHQWNREPITPLRWSGLSNRSVGPGPSGRSAATSSSMASIVALGCGPFVMRSYRKWKRDREIFSADPATRRK